MKSAYVNKRGFTIVELLIVIVVVAILAAISITAYINVTNRTHDSAVLSDASLITKNLELYKVENGKYPQEASEFPENLRITKASYATNVNNVLYCLNKGTDQYNLALVSKSGKGYWITSGQTTVVTGGVVSETGAICGEVGTNWTNNSSTTAIHGYSAATGLWWQWWVLTK